MKVQSIPSFNIYMAGILSMKVGALEEEARMTVILYLKGMNPVTNALPGNS